MAVVTLTLPWPLRFQQFRPPAQVAEGYFQ